MNPETAKKIGSTLAVKSVSIGLAIAYIIMIPLSLMGQESLFDELFWIVKWMQSEFALHIIVALAAFYGCGYYFGGKAGIDILIKHRHYLWIGPLYGLLVLLTTIFLASLIGFAQGVTHDLHYLSSFNEISFKLFYENFFNKVFKPLVWGSLFGFIPVILVGLWFGWRIRSKQRTLLKSRQTPKRRKVRTHRRLTKAPNHTRPRHSAKVASWQLSEPNVSA